MIVKIKNSDKFTLTLEDLAYGGDGVGHLPDGRAVFVPGGLPGEKVVVEVC